MGFSYKQLLVLVLTLGFLVRLELGLPYILFEIRLILLRIMEGHYQPYLLMIQQDIVMDIN